MGLNAVIGRPEAGRSRDGKLVTPPGETTVLLPPREDCWEVRGRGMLSSEGVWRNPSLAQTGAYGGSAAGASLGKSTMLAAASGTGKGGRLTDPTGMRERRTGPTNLAVTRLS